MRESVTKGAISRWQLAGEQLIREYFEDVVFGLSYLTLILFHDRFTYLVFGEKILRKALVWALYIVLSVVAYKAADRYMVRKKCMDRHFGSIHSGGLYPVNPMDIKE